MSAYLFATDGTQLGRAGWYGHLTVPHGRETVVVIKGHRGYRLVWLPPLPGDMIAVQLSNARLSWEMFSPKRAARTLPTLSAARAYLALRGEN